MSEDQIDEYIAMWNQMREETSKETMPPQNLYDLFCAKIAIDNYFRGYSLMFDFAQPHNRWVETRIKPSIEAEDYFYEAFQIRPVRENGQITAFEMIGSK